MPHPASTARPPAARTRARLTATAIYVAAALAVAAHIVDPDIWRWEMVYAMPLGFSYL